MTVTVAPANRPDIRTPRATSADHPRKPRLRDLRASRRDDGVLMSDEATTGTGAPAVSVAEVGCYSHRANGLTKRAASRRCHRHPHAPTSREETSATAQAGDVRVGTALIVTVVALAAYVATIVISATAIVTASFVALGIALVGA